MDDARIDVPQIATPAGPTQEAAAARLLRRLDAVARSLEAAGALAVLGAGSVGRETDRIDAWSDLDFFAVVRPGEKQRFIDSLDWLAAAHPIVWAFRNTDDGFKALMADGILCEFGVVEPADLTRIPYAPARVVWSAPGVDVAFADPVVPLPPRYDHGVEWLVGELLSNLFVALGRWHRGERVAAMRMAQVFAVDRMIELLDRLEPVDPAGPAPAIHVDPFVPERRVERRHPRWADRLSASAPGVAHVREGAVALLDALHDLLADSAGELVPVAVDRWIRALASAAPGEVVAFPEG